MKLVIRSRVSSHPWYWMFVLAAAVAGSNAQQASSTRSPDDLGRLALEMFRSKNGVGEGHLLSYKDGGVVSRGDYRRFTVEDVWNGKRDKKDVILTNDGTKYSEGVIVSIHDFSEEGILECYRAALEGGHRGAAGAEVLKIEMKDTLASGVRIGVMKVDAGAIQKAIPLWIDQRAGIAIYGPVYDVLSATEQARIANEGAEVRFGNPSPQRRIVVYSDFQCEFCALREQGMPVKELLANNPDVEVVFRDFPLPQHEWAFTAARIARCVYRLRPDRYIDFREEVFAMQSRISGRTVSAKLLDEASRQDIPSTSLDGCLEKPAIKEAILADVRSGRRLGIALTPTIYVNGSVYNDRVDGKNMVVAGTCDVSCKATQ